MIYLATVIEWSHIGIRHEEFFFLVRYTYTIFFIREMYIKYS
jgi:hypothetical protein